jgi:threonine dehydrogenase-like Zn-dependent dehydrogenase
MRQGGHEIMRGVVFDGSELTFRGDLPDVEPVEGEVVLNVRLAGICDTDLQIARGYLGFRGTPGHEFVAETSEGRRVTAEINAPCGQCDTCATGRGNHCPNRTVLGIVGRNGAMAERVRVPERGLHPIPDALSDHQAVFIEPLAAALRILDQVELGSASQAAVVGDGKLGLLSAWVLRSTGARVTWVGKHPEKLALGGSGIATCVLSDVETQGRTFDVVVDATGSTGGLPTALKLVRTCGIVVLKTTVAGTYAIDLAPIVIDEIRVVGSRCGPFSKAIAALQSGQFDVTRLIEAEYPLERAGEAFQHAGRPGARKVLIRVR